MSQDSRLSKVEILYQQNKFSEAEEILKELLSQDPDNVRYLALFARVNMRLKKFEVARKVIEIAIGLAPDNPLLFYVRGRIAICLRAYDEAQMNLKRCVELDPGEADYFAFLAYVKLERKDFEEALTLADQALELDAENLLGLNTRGTVLLKLNRKPEAFDTINEALRKYPNNDYTHANCGWALLEKGKPQKAKEHFKEALKIDPNYEFAQAGLLQAIMATNPPYRAYLKYVFFMDNLPVKFQFAIVIGFYLGMAGLLYLPYKNEALKPYLVPLLVTALAIVALSTWVVIPLSNLFLRFHKYGHLLLTRSERISSNFTAGSFAVFITGGALYIFTKEDKFLSLAFFGFGVVAPLGVLFSPLKQKMLLFRCIIFLFLVGLLAIYISFIENEIYNNFSLAFLLSFIAFQFLTNFLLIKNGIDRRLYNRYY